MLKRNILQLLIIVTLLSGCVFVNNDEQLKIDEVVSTENVAIIPVQTLATFTEENQIEKSNFLKGNWIPVEKINLIIDFSDKKESVQVEFKEGVTVFDVLQSGTEDLGIALETQMYGVGVFINVIGDKKNGQDNNYWTYYVNDEFANVAADKYKLRAGDRVEWKFRKNSEFSVHTPNPR
ncbi:MAG: DUF4430 domain-containing protein [Patescibacteria group bacterium]|jgi:hypothetical protein